MIVEPELPEELWGPAPSPAQQEASARRAARTARARAARVAAASITITEAARRLRTSERAVQEATTAGDLLTVPGPAGSVLVPAWQLSDTGAILPGIARLAREFAGRAVPLTLWVERPTPDLDWRTPRDALADGQDAAVIELADSLTAAGW